jgi:hypothetical protein
MPNCPNLTLRMYLNLTQLFECWHSDDFSTLKSRKIDSKLPISVLFEKAKLWMEKAAATKVSEFHKTVLNSGTVTDKVALLTVLMQQNPFEFVHFETLFAMAQKKSKREAIMAVDALKDLLLGILPDRKLKYFKAQSFENATASHLVCWYFEDSLKRTYFEFVKLLDVFFFKIEP